MLNGKLKDFANSQYKLFSSHLYYLSNHSRPSPCLKCPFVCLRNEDGQSQSRSRCPANRNDRINYHFNANRGISSKHSCNILLKSVSVLFIQQQTPFLNDAYKFNFLPNCISERRKVLKGRCH